MIVLLGTKPGFNISQKWILDRTGLNERSYIQARKALVNRGWITHTQEESIIVNIDKIYTDRKNKNGIKPEIRAGNKEPSINAGKITPAIITGKEETEKEQATITGKQHITIAGNTPAINTDIINKKQNKESNNIKENIDDNIVKDKEPILTTRAEAYHLEYNGNKLEWINGTDFYINGRFCRIKDTQ